MTAGIKKSEYPIIFGIILNYKAAGFDNRCAVGQALAMNRLRQELEPVIRRAMHAYWRFARAMTLGVRAVVLDGDGRIFLVKHSYVSGWHLPGGGVETGETLHEALARELREEGNIELDGSPVLHGMFFNKRISPRDHVAVYVVREFRQSAAPVPDREIIEHGFFAPHELPADTTRGTRARLDEVLRGNPLTELW
jgi:8-oxo-dGTP pyrophosphatase MutT (NUDIX family)